MVNKFVSALTTKKGLKVTGIFFIFLWLFDFGIKAYYDGIASFQFLWFCSILLLLLGLSYLTQNPTLSTATLALALIFQIPWMIDYISILITGNSPLGDAGYINNLNKIEFFITLRHLFIIPFALLLWWKKWRPAPYASALGVTIAGIILTLSVLLAPNGSDVNCIARTCLLGSFYYSGPIMFIGFILILTIFLFLLSNFLSFLPEKYPRLKYFPPVFVFMIISGIILSFIGYFSFF